MENANPPPNNPQNFPVAIRATISQEHRELEAISTFVNPCLEGSGQKFPRNNPRPNVVEMDNVRSPETSLEPPSSDSDSDPEDGEIFNEHYEYGNSGTLRRRNIINGYNRDELAFECRIGYMKFTTYFDPFLPINIITRKAYNSIMVEQLENTRTNQVAIAKDLCVFVGSFVYVVNFVVLENLSDFIRSNLTDVVVGKPFRELTQMEYDYEKGLVSFEWLFETYIFQMPRTIERFKTWGPFGWNKIPLILILSHRDRMSGLTNAHEKLKKMYTHCLSLGPEYRVDEDIKEWLIHGHISLHEGTMSHD